jgi:hypothetical protein
MIYLWWIFRSFTHHQAWDSWKEEAYQLIEVSLGVDKLKELKVLEICHEVESGE